MRNVFNTSFEVSLRMLLVLCADTGGTKTHDMLTAIDFLAVYAKSFGIASENLHGDSVFGFSELASRRELTREALRLLVLDGLVEVHNHKNGFQYSICSEGRTFCESFSTDYAFEYRNLAKAAYEHVKGKTEREVLAYINQRSTMSLERGVRNG